MINADLLVGVKIDVEEEKISLNQLNSVQNKNEFSEILQFFLQIISNIQVEGNVENKDKMLSVITSSCARAENQEKNSRKSEKIISEPQKIPISPKLKELLKKLLSSCENLVPLISFIKDTFQPEEIVNILEQASIIKEVPQEIHVEKNVIDIPLKDSVLKEENPIPFMTHFDLEISPEIKEIKKDVDEEVLLRDFKVNWESNHKSKSLIKRKNHIDSDTSMKSLISSYKKEKNYVVSAKNQFQDRLLQVSSKLDKVLFKFQNKFSDVSKGGHLKQTESKPFVQMAYKEIDLQLKNHLPQKGLINNMVFIPQTEEFTSDKPKQVLPKFNITKEDAIITDLAGIKLNKDKLQMPKIASTIKLDRNAIIEQIVKKMEIQVKDGKQQITIDLKPEILGKLKIYVSIKENTIKVHFLASTHVVKEAIEHGLHVLKQTFGQQGFLLSEFNVSMANEQSDFYMPKNEKQNSQTYSKKERKEKVEAIKPRMSKKKIIGLKNIDFWA